MRRCSHLACMKFGDANRDGYVTSADLDDAELYEYWEYCYAEGMAFAVQQANTPAHMNLDVDSETTTAVPMTFTEAITAMGYDDADDFGESFTALERPSRLAMRTLLMALMSGE